MKVSIVIPVYNGEKYLNTCLQSIFTQDVPIHELIIVNNNSTDRTADLLKSLQKQYQKLICVFEPVKTRGAARNAGIRIATGDVIAMTDVDCVVPTDWARKLAEPIQRGEELVTTGYQYNLLPENYWARETQRKCDYFLERQPAPSGYISFTDTKNLAVKATLLKEVGFDDRFYSLEDVDLEIRLRQFARFRFLPEVKVGHAHSSSFKAVWKMGYERSYWYMQLYHKFCNVRDIHGVLIFGEIPVWRFYANLLKFSVVALKAQGIRHLFFFLAFDISWKFGSVVGYVHTDRRFRNV